MLEETTKPDSERIRELRLGKKLTQEELATKVGCSKRTIENAEAGRRIKQSNLDDIAEVLECEPREIVIPGGDNQSYVRKARAYLEFTRCMESLDIWMEQIRPPQ